MDRVTQVVVAVVVMAGVAWSAHAQDARSVSDVESRIDLVFSRFDSPQSPGCAVGVVKDGDLVFSKAYGMADVNRGFPLTPSSPIHLASESKQFTAAAILLAAKRGKLTLDDDVRKYIPELREYGKTITLRHLLHHTSGIRDYGTLWLMRGDTYSDTHTSKDTVALLARQRELNYAPGTDFLYSNSGYFLLGVVLERATGQSLGNFSRTYFFAPLSMKNTRFLDGSEESEGRRAIGHIRQPHGKLVPVIGRGEVVGARGVVTTIEDLAKWERAFHDGKIGDGNLLEAMLTPGRLDNGEMLHYAGGLVLGDFDGTPTVSHGGEGDGSGALILRFPEMDLSVMCLCNLAGSGAAGLSWRTAIPFLYGPYRQQLNKLQKHSAPPNFVELSSDVLQRFAGTYRDPNTRAVWKVSVLGSNIVVDSGTGHFTLRSVGDTRFRKPGQGQLIEAEFRGNRMCIEVEDQRPAVLQKVKEISPSPRALDEFVGTYESDELGVPWTIEKRGGKLHFAGEGAPKDPLVPSVHDEFTLGAELRISFARDEESRVVSMSAHTERVWNIRFTKTDRASGP